MNKLLTGVSALALAAAFGTGAALANPTVSDIEDVHADGDIKIGTVDVVLGGDEVDFEQEIEGVEGGSADGGEGGDDNWADSAAGEANAGNGGMGNKGGDAKARNSLGISIENGNTAVMSTNNLDAENELSFSVFLSTGDNDGSFDGGSAEGGEGGDAEAEVYVFTSEPSEIEAVAEVEEGDAMAHAGNAEGGAGGYAEGGKGGSTETGNVTFTSGVVTYNTNAFQYSAGQFNVGANTNVADLNQHGNTVAAHVPVGVSVNN